MSALEYLNEKRMPAYAGIFAIMLASILAFILLHTSRPQPVAPPPPVTMVVIQPPKPPPPPPLPQPKTIVQPKMAVPQAKPVIPNQPPKPAPPKAASAPALGTSLKSNGSSNAFDLSGSGSGNGIIGGSGYGGGGGSYGDAVSEQIQQALQNNSVTRHASAGLTVRIWVDAGGVVRRVELEKSSGNPVMDAAIQNDVLNNLQLYPPPPGTNMPIEMSLTGEQQLQ